MENNYNQDPSHVHLTNSAQQLYFAEPTGEEIPNISYDSSSSSNSAIPTADHRSIRDSSSSESDFERFGQEEIAESDNSRRLSDFGTRLANEVLNEVVAGQHEPNASDLSTPNNEPTSPLSNFMDDRDLFVLPEAGKDEANPVLAHPISTEAHSTSQSLTQKQGDIESHSFHDLESKLEEEEADNFNLLGSSNPPIKQEQQSEPADYDELISFGDNEIHSAKPATPVKEEQEEEKENAERMKHEHYSPSSPTTIHEEETGTYPHDSVSDQDTLANLPSESVPEPHQEPEKTSSIPESSSVTGMRDLSDQEESTYERKGPLTIPASAMTPPKQETQAKCDNHESTEVEDEGLDKAHNLIPRPPTPPKELSEPEEEKPSVVDLGPPHHAHHLMHRSSEKGLQSILKKTGPWIDFTHVDPKGWSYVSHAQR